MRGIRRRLRTLKAEVLGDAGCHRGQGDRRRQGLPRRGRRIPPERNQYFKKYTTRTMRPVVDFDKCVKCTLCWLQCPDSCFDVTPEHLYDANMEACCGCGVCEVCPVRTASPWSMKPPSPTTPVSTRCGNRTRLPRVAAGEDRHGQNGRTSWSWLPSPRPVRRGNRSAAKGGGRLA